MLKDEYVKIGDHCWALLEGELLVVLKTKNNYEVCGAWECGVCSSRLELLEIIIKPVNHENTELLYL